MKQRQRVVSTVQAAAFQHTTALHHARIVLDSLIQFQKSRIQKSRIQEELPANANQPTYAGGRTRASH